MYICRCIFYVHAAVLLGWLFPGKSDTLTVLESKLEASERGGERDCRVRQL